MKKSEKCEDRGQGFGWQQALDLVFPPRCTLCGRVLSWFERKGDLGLCRLCRWQDYQNPQPVSEDEKGRCSLLYEDQLQQAIYHLKYNGRRTNGIYFARWMMEEGADWMRSQQFDRVTAVPLAKRKLKSRGYNQAEVIARELGRLSRLPYEELLVRTRNTTPQSGLGEEMRRQNLSGAFAAKECRLEPHHICLVDDIYTTGSTLRESMAVLQQRWPEAKIHYWTLARQISPDF